MFAQKDKNTVTNLGYKNSEGGCGRDRPPDGASRLRRAPLRSHWTTNKWLKRYLLKTVTVLRKRQLGHSTWPPAWPRLFRGHSYTAESGCGGQPCTEWKYRQQGAEYTNWRLVSLTGTDLQIIYLQRWKHFPSLDLICFF